MKAISRLFEKASLYIGRLLHWLRHCDVTFYIYESYTEYLFERFEKNTTTIIIRSTIYVTLH